MTSTQHPDRPPLITQVTGFILLGGKSSRYGSNKAFVEIDGVRLVDRVAGVMQSIFHRVVLVTNTPEDYAYLKIPMVEDLIKGLGPMGGIYTGLMTMTDEAGFFVACDMPFLCENLIRHMVDVKDVFDAVVPRMDWMLEPLHALYSKTCVPVIQEAIGQNEHQILKCFTRLRVRYVEEKELRIWDPDLRSFFNINKPQDLPGQNERPMTEFPPTLCAPDQEKSCFACCPPIRPPGYEHLQYASEIKRMLRENTASLRRDDKAFSPITGFSCWALGYLDGGFKRIGCLLHPGQNEGEDLRYRVDYGGKCDRESCVEAEIFKLLAPEARSFWLRLCEGLDSFSYSSRTRNPLFRILGWGTAVLNLVARAEKERDLRTESILETYAFFKTDLPARANAYLLKALVDSEHLELLKDGRFRNRFEELSHRLSRQVSVEILTSSTAPYVHRLALDPDFLNFLRLSGHIARATEEEAVSLKEFTDHELARFRDGFP